MSLLTTAQVAEELAVSEEWVRDHQVELAAIKLGDGSKARLRFEPEAITTYKARRRVEPPVAAPTPRRRRYRAPADVELIPVP